MKIVVGAMGFLASYYLAVRFGFEMGWLEKLAITVIWIPAGISVVAFMAFGWWATPLVWIASLVSGSADLAEVGKEIPEGDSLISAFAETFQGMLIWRLCRSDLPNGLASVGDLVRFGIIAGFVPIMLGGIEIAFELLLGREMAWQRLSLSVASGGVADALGIAATVPAYWVWRDRTPLADYEKSWIAFYSLLAVLVLYGSLQESPSLIFFSVPVLVGLAARTGLRGAVVGQAVLFLGLIAATARGGGPFAGTDEFREYLDLLAYISALGVATMGSAVWCTSLLTEKSRLAADLEALHGVLERESSERRQLEAQFLQRAHSDELTGLPNRAMFFDRLEQAIFQARRRSTRFALLFIDLDGFKRVNDTWGHEAGDCLLRQVAERLRACVRESDTIARMGGDEFTIIVSDISFRRSAALVADKVIVSLSEPFSWDGVQARIGASVGISLYPDDGEQVEVLLNHADAAMYAVKRRGKSDSGFYAAKTDEVGAGERV